MRCSASTSRRSTPPSARSRCSWRPATGLGRAPPTTASASPITISAGTTTPSPATGRPWTRSPRPVSGTSPESRSITSATRTTLPATGPRPAPRGDGRWPSSPRSARPRPRRFAASSFLTTFQRRPEILRAVSELDTVADFGAVRLSSVRCPMAPELIRPCGPDSYRVGLARHGQVITLVFPRSMLALPVDTVVALTAAGPGEGLAELAADFAARLLAGAGSYSAPTRSRLGLVLLDLVSAALSSYLDLGAIAADDRRQV